MELRRFVYAYESITNIDNITVGNIMNHIGIINNILITTAIYCYWRWGEYVLPLWSQDLAASGRALMKYSRAISLTEQKSTPQKGQ